MENLLNFIVQYLNVPVYRQTNRVVILRMFRWSDQTAVMLMFSVDKCDRTVDRQNELMTATLSTVRLRDEDASLALLHQV